MEELNKKALRAEFLEEDDLPTWKAFVEESENTGYTHDLRYLKAISEAYSLKGSVLLVKDENNKIMAGLPIIEVPTFPLSEKKYVSLPYSSYAGLVSNSALSQEEIKHLIHNFLTQKGIRSIEYRQIKSDEKTDETEVTFLLSLKPNENEMWKALKGKVRNQIRKSQQYQFDIQWGIKNLPFFYKLYKKSMYQHGTPHHAFRFFESLIKHLDKNCEVLTIFHDNRPIAAMLMVRHKDIFHVPFAAADTEYKHMNVNMRLYWEAIKRAIDLKCSCFEFGRSNINSGTFHFKKQWGGRIFGIIIESYADGALSEDNALKHYRSKKGAFFSSAWKLLPKNLKDFIGPRLRPLLY